MARRSAAAAAAIDPRAMHEHAGDAARLLKALANDKRLLVLCMLVEGERSVGQMNSQLDLSQSALSQHLALLREEGLVETRREAQTIWYSLAPGPVHDIIEVLHRSFCGQTPMCEPARPPGNAAAAASRRRPR